MRRLLQWTAACLLMLMAGAVEAQYTGVTATSTPGLNVRRPLTTDESILYPGQRDQTLLPGDLLTVTVFGVVPTYVDQERVALDGQIRLPLAGTVKVGGLSVSAAELKLSQFFEEKELFHDAQVSVLVTEAPNHVVTFSGSIHREVTIVGQKTLLDVLALAGGVPETTSTVMQIDRPGLAEPILVDLGNDPARALHANIPIFSGDTITTGDVGQYFVVGAVGTPGVHPLIGARPLTVMQALAATGGTTFAAKRSETRLVRTVGNTRTVVQLDLARIERGQDPDPVLQADDIVLIPSSAWKTFFHITNATGLIAIALSLVTLLRY